MGFSAQILLLFSIFTACKAWEGMTICATLLHTAILALGECCRDTRAAWTPEPLTFFSGGSLQPESLILWRSWNLTLTSSTLSWSRSQKLARSWEEGWGYVDGSWVGQDMTLMSATYKDLRKKVQCSTILQSRLFCLSCQWISAKPCTIMYIVMIQHTITHHAYHTLLAEAEKLLDFLRHEHLGAANCILNQLKNYGGNRK